MNSENTSAPQGSETSLATEKSQEVEISASTFEHNDNTMNESHPKQVIDEAKNVQEGLSEALANESSDRNLETRVVLDQTPAFKHAQNIAPEKNIDDASDDSFKTSANIENSESKEKDETASNLNSNGDNTISDDSPIIDDCNQYNQDINNSPYYIKWIAWKGLKTPIVTQNDNGPCPLLAIINILLLRRVIKFPSMQEMITTQQLMEYLGDVVLNEIPQNMGEGTQRNFEQNMQDALVILPKLNTGLDVNVKFTGVGDFEFTPECIIFDLLNIHLYHGWLVDPQNIEYKSSIAGLSYNQLVEKIVACKESSGNSQLASEGLAAESFLEETANQLTYYGICELNAKLNEDELCVFFRNNHFSTLYKHQGELFLLLTDQGFLTEDKIVWQTLANVDGDGVFVDYNFKSLPMRNEPVSNPAVSSNAALSQEDQDYMLALSIHNDQQPQQQSQGQDVQPQIPEPSQKSESCAHAMSEQELFDLQYAMQLQEEEATNVRTSQQQRREQPPQRRANRRQTPPPAAALPLGNIQQRHSASNCIIL